MQRKFQPRTLASAFSLLVHAGLLGLLWVGMTGQPGGRVSVLEVQVVSGTAQEKPARRPQHPKDSKGTLSRAARPADLATSPLSAVTGNPGLRASYINDLRAAIESMKAYPTVARARRQEGRVEISFTLRKDGTITDVSVTRSSTFAILDEAGATTLARLNRFRPIPDDVSPGDLKLVLPLEFRLEY